VLFNLRHLNTQLYIYIYNDYAISSALFAGKPKESHASPSQETASTNLTSYSSSDIPSSFSARPLNYPNGLHHSLPPKPRYIPPLRVPSTKIFLPWNSDEDALLMQMISEFGFNWSLISDAFSRPKLGHMDIRPRNPWECYDRYTHLLKHKMESSSSSQLEEVKSDSLNLQELKKRMTKQIHIFDTIKKSSRKSQAKLPGNVLVFKFLVI